MFDLLITGVDDACSMEPWRLGDTDLGAAVVALEVAARRLGGAQLRLLAEGVARGLPATAGAGIGSAAPGRWLRTLLPLTPGEAARRTALAATFFATLPGSSGAEGTDPAPTDELAPTRAALLAGSLSAAHATLIAGTLAELADLVPAPGDPVTGDTGVPVIDPVTRAEAHTLLLSAAVGSAEHSAVDPGQLARIATTLRATLDPAAGDRLARDEDRQERARGLTLVPTGTGMWHLSGRLTPLAGHSLHTALQAFAAPRPTSDGTPDPRTGAQRLHDAAQHSADLILSAAPGSALSPPTTHGTATRLVITVPAHTLAAHLGLAPSPRVHGAAASCPTTELGDTTVPSPTQQVTAVAELPGRWPLSPLAARTLACDADLVAVLTGGDGQPLDVADTTYVFSPRQRAAITSRDGHCTYTTCTAPPAWCHVHHLTPFSRGGPTSLANGALLCATHHRHVHAHHLSGTLHEGGGVTWHSTAPGNPHQPAPAAERAIEALARRWRQRQAAPPRTPPRTSHPVSC